MTKPTDPLAVGKVVGVDVVAHHPWGIGVQVVDVDAVAMIDIRFVSDDPAEMNEDRFPPVGTRLRAVIQGRMPNGQLRVTVRRSDLERAGQER